MSLKIPVSIPTKVATNSSKVLVRPMIAISCRSVLMIVTSIVFVVYSVSVPRILAT